MQMNPNESGAHERAEPADNDMAASVHALEAMIPTLATRAQLEQLRGETKEGFGEVRAEMKDGFAAADAKTAALRAEMKDGFAAADAKTAALRVEMKEGFGTLRAEMKEGFGALRAEMKEGLGSGRAEMHKTTGDHHLETQGMIFGLLKWSVGFAFGLIGVATTVFAAVLPFIRAH